jgi:hypothetical protein
MKKFSKKEIKESTEYFQKKNKQWQMEDEEKNQKIPLESYIAIIVIIVMFFGYIWLYVYSSGQ